MSKHGLAAVAVRIAGLVIGLYAIRNGAMHLAADPTIRQDPWVWLPLTSTVMMFSTAFCMVIFPTIIVQKLIPRDESPPESSTLSIADIEILATSLVGLYVLVQAVLDATYMGTLWFAIRQTGYPWIWTAEYIATTVTAVAELLVGLWLLFGARGLMSFVRWARTYGEKYES